MPSEREVDGAGRPTGAVAAPRDLPLQASTPTAAPLAARSPTEGPPTEAPPTEAPPTEAPPTEAPPTEAPPTEAPPTEASRTAAPPPRTSPGEAFLDRLWRRSWSLALVLLAVGLLALHQAHFDYFFCDDGFISLRYTRRLLDGDGLTFNTGERVEGYSNLLWVLLCAVPGLFGSELVFGARLVGFLCSVLVFFAIIAFCRPKTMREGLAPALGMGVLVASDSFVVWSIGGLEPPLIHALLSWALVLCWRRQASPRAEWGGALLCGLLVWCRPDAPLLAVLVGCGVVWIRGWEGMRQVALIACALVVFLGAQATFRFFYYDDVVPNTAYAKVVLSEDRVRLGLEYWEKSLSPLSGTWFVLFWGVFAGVFRRQGGRQALVLTLMGVIWTAYIVVVGGDYFPAWRQLVYVVVIGAWAAVVMLRGALDESRAFFAPLLFASALVVFTFVTTTTDPMNWAKIERWEWDGKTVGESFALAWEAEQPLIAVDASGALPYYANLPTLDMLGLTDRFLAHNAPQDLSSLPMGHGLGDAEYYWTRLPDVICFGVAPCSYDAKYRAQRQMVERAEFAKTYQLATLAFVRTPPDGELIGQVWIRREGRVGVRRRPDEIFVPGLLFSRNDAPARFDGKTFRATAHERELRFDGLALEPGQWRAVLEAPVGEGSLRAIAPSFRGARGDSRTGLSLRVPRAGVFSLHVRGKGELSFSGIRLQRTAAVEEARDQEVADESGQN